MEKIEIIDAMPEDAPMIADAIMSAVGEDIVDSLGGSHGREAVKNIFENLARREDSQYSFHNTRIAVLPDGTKAGVCISYDGSLIFELRRSFFEQAHSILGWNYTDEEISRLPGETSSEEFYLDTLATLPEFRGRGIGKALIADAARKAALKGLPLGLLVSDHNPSARHLYEAQGFREVERRFFAGEEMTNMRK